jgi:hypothetical protein
MAVLRPLATLGKGGVRQRQQLNLSGPVAFHSIQKKAAPALIH